MADKINLIIDQGTTYSVNFQVKNSLGEVVDLSDYTGAAQFRRNYTSNNAVSFGVSTYANGIVTCSLTANQTSTVSDGKYVYDVELTNSMNEVTRIVEGIITITPQVTK